jgi:hypothetical protein
MDVLGAILVTSNKDKETLRRLMLTMTRGRGGRLPTIIISRFGRNRVAPRHVDIPNVDVRSHCEGSCGHRAYFVFIYPFDVLLHFA